MQKYSTYKPTNVEWLGDVPRHWKVDKLKNYCEIFASGVDKKIEEGEIEVSLCNYVDVYKNQIIDKSIQFMTATATQGEIEKFSLQLNDIIVTKDSETPDDIAVPAIVKEVFQNFLCGYHLSIIRSVRKIEPDFLIWVLRDLNIATQFHREAIGITRYGLASKHFKNGIITFPIKAEQTLIAEFLDQATANIDKVIATKQQQLEQLEQWRKSKIHECVSKGLSSDLKLNPSGFGFIADVPEGWKVERVKDVVELRTGKTSEKSDEKNYLELEDIEQWTGNIIGFRDTLEVSSDVTIFKKGDVLFGKLRPYLAKYWLADRDGTCTGEIISFNCFKIHNAFFKYFIGSPKFIELCTAVSYGAKMPRVDWTRQIAYFYIAFPERNEQIEIANYLDNFCISILKEKEIIEQQIEKLKLYRKCLIHECVTGKRKVTE